MGITVQNQRRNYHSLSPCDLLHGSLIPGLPNDIAFLCLLKVPRIYHSSLRSVSSLWRKVVRSPEFYEDRREMGISDAWLVVLSTEPMTATVLFYAAYDLRLKQLLFKARFPPLSHLEACGLEHYRLVAMNENFAVLGTGRDSWWGTKDWFTIYNTITNEWKEGAAIGVSRQRFACGVIDGNLYVAGGIDNSTGRAERSTEMYNFKTDEWKTLARMPEDVGRCVEADVVFQGKLYVRCSGALSKQTLFWSYDPKIDQWMEEAKLSSSVLGAGQLVATEEWMYALSVEDEIHRFVKSSNEWKSVTGSAGRESQSSLFNVRSQRAFGYGDEIFILNSGCQTRSSMSSSSSSQRSCSVDGRVKCHKLFLGNSWYRAGAIVEA